MDADPIKALAVQMSVLTSQISALAKGGDSPVEFSYIPKQSTSRILYPNNRNHENFSYGNTKNVLQPPVGFKVANGEIIEEPKPSSNLENILASFMSQTNTFMNETRNRFNKDEEKLDKIEGHVTHLESTMGAQMKNLENQIGQLAKVVGSQHQRGRFPSTTEDYRGYMVGNGVTDNVFEGNALIPSVHGMGLISDELVEAVSAECKGNYYNSTNKKCEDELAKVDAEIEGLNIYDILEPCEHDTSSKIRLENTKLPLSFRRLGETERALPVRKRMFGRAWPLRANDDKVANAWLKNEAVREAIHADTGKWELCTSKITFLHDAGSMIKYHKNLTSRGYRALIYSGDHDMCVPSTGSEAWVRSVGYITIDEWRSWMVKDQVAGGDGPNVPEYKPLEALEFYSRWL
ncbi:hypothetical protein OROHE_007257 [Orobanche hederae]